MPPESAAERTDPMPADGGGVGGPRLTGLGVPSGDDWAAHLTEKVESTVSIIRDKTVRPVSTFVRYLIFGLLAAVVGVTMAVLFAIFAIRVLDTEVPVFRTRVWASYLVVAGIFWLAGLLLSRKRHPRT